MTSELAKFEYWILDIDSTLVDSRVSILECLNEILRIHELKISGVERLAIFGPSLEDFFADLGLSQSRDLAEHFAEIYQNQFIEQVKVIDGVPKFLNKLKENGRRVFVVSSNSHYIVQRSLEMLELDIFVDRFIGIDANEQIRSKIDAVHFLDFPHKAKVVVLGDTYSDSDMANHFQFPFIFAAYGYGDPSLANREGTLLSVGSLDDILD